MASIADLPPEILLKIFQFYMETESHKTFLDTIGAVCVAWKSICLESCLWREYDGTPTFKQMMYLSEKRALRNTRLLILSSIDSLQSVTDENEQCITNVVNMVENSKKLKLSSSDSLKTTINEADLFKNVQNVEVISFIQVDQLSKDTLALVAQNCTKLTAIKIGEMNKSPSSVLSYEILLEFFSMRGFGLTKIDFSFCEIINFTKSMQCIADYCPNLEYLHLRYTDSSDCVTGEGFPTGYVQEHCPKLKALRIDMFIKIQNTRHPSGFPDLEEFVYVDDGGDIYRDELFKCVLFNSPKLKFLYLPNSDISASALLSLPARSVEYLYIARTTACNDDSLCDLLKKWSHSLKEVDLSYGFCYVHFAVLDLIETPAVSLLEFLNLSYTLIKLDLIENIFKKCPHLKTLKLEGCTYLKREMRRTYSGKLELQELTETISSYRSTHP